jgi:tripartite-type tricarboxylate transporter receptor subunit TctC
MSIIQFADLQGLAIRSRVIDVVFDLRAGQIAEGIVDKLNREIVAAMAKPEVQARMRRDGLLTEAMSPEAFTKFVASESARWTPLIQRAGLAGKGQ